jgi:hypothetical protein
MSDNLILGDDKFIFSSENHFLVPPKEYDGQKFELSFRKLINNHTSLELNFCPNLGIGLQP